MNTAALNIHVQVFVFNYSGSITRGRIPGSYGNSILNFLRNCHILISFKNQLYHDAGFLIRVKQVFDT